MKFHIRIFFSGLPAGVLYEVRVDDDVLLLDRPEIVARGDEMLRVERLPVIVAFGAFLIDGPAAQRFVVKLFFGLLPAAQVPEARSFEHHFEGSLAVDDFAQPCLGGVFLRGGVGVPRLFHALQAGALADFVEPVDGVLALVAFVERFGVKQVEVCKPEFGPRIAFRREAAAARGELELVVDEFLHQ